MNALRWLLVPQASQALQQRAHQARQHGAGRLTVALHLLWCVLAWSLLRLETPAWRRVLQQRQRKAQPYLGVGANYALSKALLLGVGADFTRARLGAEKSNLRNVSVVLRVGF